MTEYAVLYNSFDGDYSVIYRDGYYNRTWLVHGEYHSKDDAELVAEALNAREQKNA